MNKLAPIAATDLLREKATAEMAREMVMKYPDKKDIRLFAESVLAVLDNRNMEEVNRVIRDLIDKQAGVV